MVKLDKLNVVTHTSDSQDILTLDQPSEEFHDAQESLCLESTVAVEILVSGGEISHAWILDSGASLHVTPHREWFSRYEEIVGIVTLGKFYVCDIVGIGDIPMVLSNGMRFVIENVHHVPCLTRNLISIL